MSDNKSLHLDISALRGDLELHVALSLRMTGIVGLLGPSGSGKTSLLRIIAGLDHADGHVRFGDDIWLESVSGKRMPCHRRPVGLVFQDGRLFPHLRVHQNLRYAQKRATQKDSGLTFEAVVDALHISALLDRWPSTLSGGERQRVALARSLLTAPSLLLMDEPLSALDRRTKAELLPFLGAVPRQFGIPVLFVSHAIEEVAQLADHVVLLSRGRIAAEGPVPDIFQEQALHDFTGAFDAGSILQSTIIGHDPDWHMTYVSCDSQMVTIPLVRSLDSGALINLRVRARDVTLSLQKPDQLSTQNALFGHISQIEMETESAFCEVTIKLHTQSLRARITRKSVHMLSLSVGDPVYALIKGTSFDRRALL